MNAPASLPLALVYPKDDGRPVVPGQVRVLAESMKALGLKTPITVRPSQQYRSGQLCDAYEIVVGRHRYEAALSLQWEEIDAFVTEGSAEDAELWEIDENFARAELTDAQRADHHARRERILIAKGIVKDAPKGGRPAKNLDNLSKYSEHAAEALGVDERTVRRDLARGKNIASDILASVAGTDLDKGVVLDELASTPRDQQAAKVDEIRERRSSVRPAPDPLNDPEAHEKQLSALMSAWNRAAAVVREEFLLRIEQPVFDNTRSGRAA